MTHNDSPFLTGWIRSRVFVEVLAVVLIFIPPVEVLMVTRLMVDGIIDAISSRAVKTWDDPAASEVITAVQIEPSCVFG